MIDKAGKKRHHLVVGAIRAVIEEQSRQRVEDPTAVLDAGKLGRVSEKMTSWATQLAYKAGLDDEKIVQQIYNSPAVTPPPPPPSRHPPSRVVFPWTRAVLLTRAKSSR